MRSLVDLIEARVGDRRVLVVRLEVGRLTCVLPDALRFCFDVVGQGRSIEGARLEIDEIPASATCRDCDRTDRVEGPVPLCACGSANLHIRTGHELRLKELEVR